MVCRPSVIGSSIGPGPNTQPPPSAPYEIAAGDVSPSGWRALPTLSAHLFALPLTGRRYDYLWSRLGRHLPWVAAQQVTIHWLRYTTLTWVERNFSYAIARTYAGHVDNNSSVGRRNRPAVTQPENPDTRRSISTRQSKGWAWCHGHGSES